MAEDEVEIAPGLHGPAGWTTVARVDGGQVSLDIEFQKDAYRVKRLTVTADEDEGVTGVMLRGIPVQQLLVSGIESAMKGAVFPALGPMTGLTASGEAERMRAQGPTDETLRAVARAYVAGRAMGKPPAKYVEDVFGAPRTTVSKWVRRAREKGLLDGER